MTLDVRFSWPPDKSRHPLAARGDHLYRLLFQYTKVPESTPTNAQEPPEKRPSRSQTVRLSSRETWRIEPLLTLQLQPPGPLPRGPGRDAVGNSGRAEILLDDIWLLEPMLFEVFAIADAIDDEEL
jgi:hypothetical protein